MQVIFRDDWAGHRTYAGEPIGDRSEWVDWDYALMDAVQTIIDFTDENGLLAWEVAEDGVIVESQKTFDKFAASVDRKTSKKDYKPQPGERWKPVIKPKRGKESYQTFAEWRAVQEEGETP